MRTMAVYLDNCLSVWLLYSTATNETDEAPDFNSGCPQEKMVCSSSHLLCKPLMKDYKGNQIDWNADCHHPIWFMDRTETQALKQDAFTHNWPYVPFMDYTCVPYNRLYSWYCWPTHSGDSLISYWWHWWTLHDYHSSDRTCCPKVIGQCSTADPICIYIGYYRHLLKILNVSNLQPK